MITRPSPRRHLARTAAATLLFASPALCGLLAVGEARAQEVIELNTVTIDSGEAAGAGETGYGPVDGFVATRSLTATKTDTPLVETPQSISVVTRDQIEKQNVRSVGATLRYTAGVGGETTGASDTRFGGLQIRGFDSTGNAFFRDGLRLPSTAFASFLGLDPYGAERIEVLKGPSSVLYGQSGPGGLLNYVSKRPTDAPLREISVNGGDFDRIEGQFDLGGPITADGAWLYRLTGLARNSGSEVDFVDDRLFIAPALTWQPDADTSLTLLGNYQRDRAGWCLQFLPATGTVSDNDGRTIPLGRFVGEPGFDRYDTDQASAAYTYLDTEITADPDGGNEGRELVTVPRHRVSLWGDYTVRDGTFDGLGFGAGVRYVGSSFGDDANTFKVSDATVADAAISFERDNYELSVNASNLFDKRYVASCFNGDFGCFYAEGRRVLGKTTIRW